MYQYVGDIPLFQGHTALGQFVDGVFKVQVNDIKHIWSHWWHATTFEHWEPM